MCSTIIAVLSQSFIFFYENVKINSHVSVSHVFGKTAMHVHVLYVTDSRSYGGHGEEEGGGEQDCQVHNQSRDHVIHSVHLSNIVKICLLYDKNINMNSSN